MPKRSRQAHVPTQVRRRKARRDAPEPAVQELITHVEPFAPASPAPMAVAAAPSAQPGRRLSEARAGVARQTGYLPTFEHAYLVQELRQIGITSTILLGLIIVLTIVLR